MKPTEDHTVTAAIEHLTVSVIAVVMALVGYGLIGLYEEGPKLFRLDDAGWTVWSSVVSVLTWLWLYRMCRALHWLVLPVMGLVSPLIGAVLFFVPYGLFPFIVIWDYAVVVFPTGVACGFLISAATLPYRPRAVLHGNA